MTRPLHLAYPGALSHVTARGNARQASYTDAQAWQLVLEVLAEVVTRSRWLYPASGLMLTLKGEPLAHVTSQIEARDGSGTVTA